MLRESLINHSPSGSFVVFMSLKLRIELDQAGEAKPLLHTLDVPSSTKHAKIGIEEQHCKE